MPRFSVKDLLLGMTLLAAGMGLIYYVYQHPRLGPSDGNEWLRAACCYGGGALLCAGVMIPLKGPWVPVVVSVVFFFLTVLLLMLFATSW
jgi:hypothetical protein